MAKLLGNRVTEKDVRDWLDANGFYGRSAVISDLELHAIKRPGWRQVFRFTAQAKTSVQESESPSDSAEDPSITRQTLFGAILDDQRQRTEDARTQIVVYDSRQERDQQLEFWSTDMLTCSTGQGGELTVLISLVIVFILIAVLLGSWIG